MPDHEFHEIRTEVTVVTPAPGATDLTDPATGQIVIPQRVELELHRTVTLDRTGEWAFVHVHGPRRLKSGDPGREISSYGWESADYQWGSVSVHRPDWLTRVIADALPEGWSPSLIDLSTTTCFGCDTPIPAGTWCSQRCRNFDDQHDEHDNTTPGDDTDA